MSEEKIEDDLIQRLSNMLDLTCDHLTDKLKNGTINAAELGVIRALLKDSGISAAPTPKNSIGKLAEATEEATEGRYDFPFAPQGAILPADDPVVMAKEEQA